MLTPAKTYNDNCTPKMMRGCDSEQKRRSATILHRWIFGIRPPVADNARFVFRRPTRGVATPVKAIDN